MEEGTSEDEGEEIKIGVHSNFSIYVFRSFCFKLGIFEPFQLKSCCMINALFTMNAR